ncbi:hypothetical protein NA56DRAFT_640201 [Hyaloscypha hepaticicola]|uniref:Uncharacterized protein n=1 Tax=Hyaloscypha hepaticicola TaxID=2082293 RepID=A0A2J6QQQ2_9HELO|nr:hypothetical protein NA56DRAFT_640201 [Hyaloscypha hepaticicola]
MRRVIYLACCVCVSVCIVVPTTFATEFSVRWRWSLLSASPLLSFLRIRIGI